MPRGGHLTWRATYEPGRVVATGYKDGRHIMTQTIATTKAPSSIVATPDRTAISADGRDVAIVTIELRDQKGRRVPDACRDLTFSLEGEGRILGAGNGDPAYLGPDHPHQTDCRAFSIPAFNGLAQVLIQAGRNPSTLRLTTTADGLSPATTVIAARHAD